CIPVNIRALQERERVRLLLAASQYLGVSIGSRPETGSHHGLAHQNGKRPGSFSPIAP
ncbi:hypothetical protein HETIRDRAFT_325037, partial [Heterobasidion irregulare TC 32-1]